MSQQAKEIIKSHTWPGIRELKTVLLQASFLTEGEEIYAHHLQIESVNSPLINEQQTIDFPSTNDSERIKIQQALKHLIGIKKGS